MAIDKLSLDQAVSQAMTSRRQIKERNKDLVKRWEKVGLLEGLNEHQKYNMARLLDNQLIGLKESGGMLPNIISEASANMTQTAANKEAWYNIAFPLVRRVFGNLFAEELVSVQALDMPTGYIFYLDYLYATNKVIGNGGGSNYVYTSSDSLYGNPTASHEPTGRWYGGTDFSYTRNYVSESAVSMTTGAAAWSSSDYDPDLSASIVAGEYKLVTIAKSAVDATYTSDENQAKSIVLVSGTAVGNQPRRYNRYDASTGNYTFLVSGALANFSHSINVQFVRKASETSRGDFEMGATGVTEIPQVKVQFKREQVEAATRKIRTTWTPEIVQDLEAYHGYDLEEEISNILGIVLGQEVDLQILNMLYDNAVDKMYWSRQLSKYVDKWTGQTVAGTITYYGTQKDWYQTLYERIADMSNLIHRRSHLGGATHLVVSTEVSTILETSGLLFGTPANEALRNSAPTEQFSSGAAQFIGGLGTTNGWKVFKSPFVRSNQILVSRKGTEWMDTGAVYAPYVPITYTDTLINPDDFTLVKGAMMRDTMRVVKPEFFSTIVVQDLNIY